MMPTTETCRLRLWKLRLPVLARSMNSHVLHGTRNAVCCGSWQAFLESLKEAAAPPGVFRTLESSVHVYSSVGSRCPHRAASDLPAPSFREVINCNTKKRDAQGACRPGLVETDAEKGFPLPSAETRAQRHRWKRSRLCSQTTSNEAEAQHLPWQNCE